MKLYTIVLLLVGSLLGFGAGAAWKASCRSTASQAPSPATAVQPAALIAMPNVPKDLEGRVKLYWESTAKRRFDICFVLEDPQSRRQNDVMEYILFQGNPKITVPVREATVTSVTVHDDKTTATAKLTRKILSPVPFVQGLVEQDLEDLWVLQNGEWLHKTPRIFPSSSTAKGVQQKNREAAQKFLEAAKAVKADPVRGTPANTMPAQE